jgi:5'-nucleotidase/UDP-sugar diphosphatase
MSLTRWGNAFKHTLGFFCILSSSLDAQARPIQIIHTNDLHSHMDFAGTHPGRGGYAAVKTVIDRLKAQADSQGIPTLILDAGDFSEGHPYFMADEGLRSWDVLNEMGYDAVALGNHDYQVGTIGMESILSRFKPRYALLAANYRVDKKFVQARETIRPYAEFKRDGLRIAVLGLTTNELFYRWTAAPGGKVKDPLKTAKKVAKDLASRSDFVIALTHLGIEKDISLLEKTPEIGLIVGGHSHTFLSQPVWVERSGIAARAPIVQAGEHGQFVGDLLVDIEPGLEPVVLRYGLVEVDRQKVADDVNVAHYVSETRDALERRYGAGWLDEVIGWSDIPMERPINGTTAWGAIFARTFRERAGADIGMDVGEFYGPSQEGGPITRDKLMRFYPRTFDQTNPKGWTIWTVQVHGKALEEVIKGMAKTGTFFNLDGLTYRVNTDAAGKIHLDQFRVGGKKINPVKLYTLAVGEGLGLGSKRAHWLTSLYFNPQDTGIPIWDAVVEHVRALRVAVHGASVRN